MYKCLYVVSSSGAYLVVIPLVLPDSVSFHTQCPGTFGFVWPNCLCVFLFEYRGTFKRQMFSQKKAATAHFLAPPIIIVLV